MNNLTCNLKDLTKLSVLFEIRLYTRSSGEGNVNIFSTCTEITKHKTIFWRLLWMEIDFSLKIQISCRLGLKQAKPGLEKQPDIGDKAQNPTHDWVCSFTIVWMITPVSITIIT
ncbi:hypothetical protein fugu_007292 [Takifugu bimaculatus]|uniref:Uncharacterized protein n=1 Tax=Takifugu bimaculatus TaxID=433685 RepID=A0A4Z2B3Y4_9TELE|nr:hypothetical protein fugu_007292 [Takifugu bimaculatus]